MNYFNTLSQEQRLAQLGKFRLLGGEAVGGKSNSGIEKLRGMKIVIVGCGAQGLNQGLNMRDSGLDVSYAMRQSAITERRESWRNASGHGFAIGTYEQLIPQADLVLNLTPDKQHSAVVAELMPLMKQGAVLCYAHGFNIVEEGMQIRQDITVIMLAPKGPGSEVREEYRRGSGVPTLLAVHPENDPQGAGLEIAKACAVALGAHRAGIMESSFVAEVKSDLLGEQTIICGILQTGCLLFFERMVQQGIKPAYAAALMQHGWAAITEGIKRGGITYMMEQLSEPARIMAFEKAAELKQLMVPLFQKHMDDILSGDFSTEMMKDWENGDKQLLQWRAAIGETGFEKAAASTEHISEHECYNKGILMVALLKAGAELTFETLTAAGLAAESAYYDAVYEVPLVARLIARKKLHEMGKVISDTAEYGCHLFTQRCIPLLQDFMQQVDTDLIGGGLSAAAEQQAVNKARLNAVNESIRSHPIEQIGRQMRQQTAAMLRPAT